LSWDRFLLRAERLLGVARLLQPDGVEVVADVVALRGRDLLLVEGVHRLLRVRALDLRVPRGGLALGRLALHEVRADVGALAELRLDPGLLGVEFRRVLGARPGPVALAEAVARLVGLVLALDPVPLALALALLLAALGAFALALGERVGQVLEVLERLRELLGLVQLLL